ncbi:MAG: TraB/GumN family protein [Ignavibacteriota bacterium]|jgi:pheromone shutdown-related protein TraB|nr:MAG: TraB/GumN family protein [Chlorobiota bacterium]MBE7475649.1 TraB/GumN family protein [Ignavibacteriales bacterium]MBL1123040.1 TraB/GumN family protein [Ignavibacteriota bacterium]MCE7855746.1 TraB/GumN family protein [Ignavibacteria bacterium CHB3]MCL4279023.1 TraB/GumN family protein [Ignavibacteriaceae bacterium]MEB2295085.1 TraB/GumN family protein [Ignavibacteria bacterium]
MTELVVNKYGEDVHFINKAGREFIIVGTAHISRQSADLVKEVIEKEKPNVVCVELDEKRLKALSEKNRWENLDLRKIIKEKQLSTLIVNLVLSSYQKKLGEKLGVSPGTELLEAVQVANEKNIPIELCDREVRITLRRAWHSMNLWQKSKFLAGGLGGLFEKQELTEEKLAELRNKDVLSEMMDELGKAMPVLKKIIIDERDQYIAQKMKDSNGKKIVSVVGAGHVKGIKKFLESNEKVDLKSIEEIPKPPVLNKILGWGIPFIIVASIFYIGFSQGITEAGSNALFWILACGIPSAIGSLLAVAHPVTILVSFLSAPITSLSPLIGVGYVAAFVQAYMQPPIVKEFQEVSKDFRKVSNWWKNRLLKVFLVFILSSIGGVIGTSVGFFEIVRNVFK